MWKIKLKGQKDEITLNDQNGMLIKSKWEDRSVPDSAKFTGGDHAFEKGQIKYMFKVEDKKKNNDEYYNKINQEYTQAAKKFAALSSKDKVNSRTFHSYFNLLFRVLYGVDPTPEILDSIKPVAWEWYEANPKRKFPDPVYLRDSGVLSKDTKANKFGLSLIERIILADRKESSFV